MRVKKVAVISLIVVVCLVALALGVWHFMPHSVQIAQNNVSEYRIVAEGDSPQIQAAAAYLAHAIYEHAGADLPEGDYVLKVLFLNAEEEPQPLRQAGL